MSDDNGKTSDISSHAVTIYLKLLLHAFVSGSTGYSSIWRNNIKNDRSQINSNISIITPSPSLINETNVIGTS